MVFSTEATTRTVYFLKAHLGSIRATVLDSATAPVIGYDDYDPWGYPLVGRTKAIPNAYMQGASKNKFTGMVWDDEYGLNLFHTPFRSYDPLKGRWVIIDPLAEKYPSLNPYNYAANSPLFFTDTSGDSLINVRIVNSEGFIHGADVVIIDHTYLNDLTNILQAAVTNRVHIHINSSFRSTAQQNSPAIQQQGTTPAQGGTSRHEAGFAVDFNLYQ